MKLIDWLLKNGAIKSKSEGKRLIQKGSIDLLYPNYRLKRVFHDLNEEIVDNLSLRKL